MPSILRNAINMSRGMQPVRDTPQIASSTDHSLTPPVGLRSRMPDIPDSYIKDTVLRKDKEASASRLNHPGYVHVSSLIGICTRQYALAQRYSVEAVETVTGGHRIMWAMGRAVEKHVRGQFLEGQGYMGIYGIWRCRCKKIDHLGMYPNKYCNSCNTKSVYYAEPVLQDEENKIVGSPDITFLMGRYYFVPVELKSMNKEDWNALERPLPDHVAQASMYRYLYKKKGFLVHDKVKFVYTTKDFKFGDPYKEYAVDCTQPAVEAIVSDMVEAARVIKNAADTRTLPARQICQTAKNGRAKSCPVAHLCFSMGNDG